MTADQAQAVVQVLTMSMEREAQATRKVIAAVPNDNRGYKPDPKSRSAWEIAVHLATSDVWFADSILGGAFVWTGEPPTPAEMTDPSAVAAWYEKHMTPRYARLRAMTPEHMLREVEFFGQKAPAFGWLSLMSSHAIHHRGQLAAYLRAAGSKVPAIYGVSADENVMA